MRQVNELAGVAGPADRAGDEPDYGTKDVRRDAGARTTGNVVDKPLVVNFQESRKGLVLPPGGPAPEDGRRIADEGLPTLMKILGKGEGKTEEDRAALARLGDQLLHLSKADPSAFERFDPKLREFATIFGRNWEYRQNRLVNLPRGDVKYHTPDKAEVSRKAWDGAMREAAVSAADEVLVAPAKRKALLKGIADVPAYLGKGVDLFGGPEGVRAATERYEKLVEAHLGRSEEFRNLKPLERSEAVGNVIGLVLLATAVELVAGGVG
ncbi:MAG: hypothetical protein IH626_07205, partial [Rhodospirillales bacterium]|nr:hypothetical protein [Rhodospirillales bacterium]